MIQLSGTKKWINDHGYIPKVAILIAKTAFMKDDIKWLLAK
jgi:hypothetical protein